MSITQRSINAELRVCYLDQEVIQQQLQNCFLHSYNLPNVIDYIHTNLFLNAGQNYSADSQNFLFISTNFDIELTIDGTKQFSITEFMLIQRDYTFTFSIIPLIIPAGCNVNVHILHGKLLMDS